MELSRRRAVLAGRPCWAPAAPSATRQPPRGAGRAVGHALDDYLARQPVVAVWIAQGRTLHVARHRHGIGPESWWLSNSMAKSVTSIAIGFALAEGRIRSLDEPAATDVPALSGHAYGETRIRNLLRMASGVRFSERDDGRDDGRDDFARFSRDAAVVGLV